jgi:hypothetical protein
MNVSSLPTHDIKGALLAVLFIVGLIVGFLWVLRPFVPAVKWAIMIVIASC